jgi:Subtilase family
MTNTNKIISLILIIGAIFISPLNSTKTSSQEALDKKNKYLEHYQKLANLEPKQHVSNNIIVQFANKNTDKETASKILMTVVDTNTEVRELGSGFFGLELKYLGETNSKINSKLDTKLTNIIKNISKINEVELVDINSFEIKKKNFVTPDLYYPIQYNMNKVTPPSTVLSTPNTSINLDDAWDYTRGSPNVVIANIDSGWDLPTADFDIEPGAYDFGSNDYNVNVPSNIARNNSNLYEFHANLTSSVIASKSTSGPTSVTPGVCPNCKILPIKITDDMDLGTELSFVAGLNYAASKAKVITIQLGNSTYSQIEQNAINIIRQRGIPFVSSSGNNNSESVGTYPSQYDNMIGVGAITLNRKKTSYSNYGYSTKYVMPINAISASTGAERQAMIAELFGTPNYVNGTSFTAPMVTGIIGLMYSSKPSMTYEEMIYALDKSATSVDSDNPQYAGKLGKGFINAFKALSALNTTKSIYWRNNDGTNVDWVMDNNIVAASKSSIFVPNNWTLSGVSDFNNDGVKDRLWRDKNNGDTVIWNMKSDGGVLASHFLGNIPNYWSISAIGDLTNDQKTDIIWRNTDGGFVIWKMNNNQIVDSLSFQNIPMEWKMKAISDFNGDTKGDIIWRNINTGDNLIWYMNGTSYVSENSIPLVPTDWNIAGVADFDNDSKGDIVWRNNNGTNVIWYMNNNLIKSAVTFPTVPTNWYIGGLETSQGVG